MTKKIFFSVSGCFWVLAFFVLSAVPAGASNVKSTEPVELKGDTIEYKSDEGKFVATGNVYLKQDNAVLFCDKLEFYRDKKEAHAEGNVILESDKGKIWAEKVFYNFQTKKGEFTNARLLADPIYGRARSIIKVKENYYIVYNGYLTTSDYDIPEYRVRSKRIDVYPGDKAVARSSVMYLGGIPVLYLPQYTQDLSGKRPHFSVTPGYKKNFGPFVFMTYHTALTDRIETTYHLDYRLAKGLGWGIDTKYNSNPFGRGLVRTYYTHEDNTDTHRAWSDASILQEKQQRYRVEWRHQWEIDPSTLLIGQYNKETDPYFLKHYFIREYRTDGAPPTYAMLTHTTAKTSLSLLADIRVNRFESKVERLPEVNFTLSNQEIGGTGFYFKSVNTAVSLVKTDPSPSDIHYRTLRLDSDNDLSRPFKLSFLEFRPYTGVEETAYSRTLDSRDNNSVRHIFRTGTDVSTKFYKVYDFNYNRYGIEINRLRHVITPTAGYLFQHHPSLASSKLFPYDGIDARTQTDSFSLGLENKLQTKREGKSVDVLRAMLTTDFRLKDNHLISSSATSMTEYPSSASFGDVKLATEFTPNKYVSLYSDLTYDNDLQHLRTANLDLYMNSCKNWTFDLSRRYTLEDDDIVTTLWEYKLNPKWRTMVYDRWNIDSGTLQEQRYGFVRDLHSWEVEFSVGRKKTIEKPANEVWVIFRIKAFPSFSTGGDTAFSHIRSGAQPY
ncbi:MAG: LPS assembly protein LptD [Candidatus Omnitrophota bacterium]